MAKMFKISFELYGIVNTMCVDDAEEANEKISIITAQGKHPCVWWTNAGYNKATGKTIWAYQGCNQYVDDAKKQLFGVVDEFEVAYLKDNVKHTHKDTYAVCFDYFNKVKKAGLPVFVTKNGKVVASANLPVRVDKGAPVKA